MIITRTPFRISFFGGGTDYPAWSNEHGGEVLSTSIDKYCYITCRHLPPFFDYKHRIVYSAIENVRHWDEIKHPAVRAVLGWTNCSKGLEIHHDGDLPARSGLGSSSSFTVGLLHALSALKGQYVSKDQLARDAIHIEQNVIGEAVGSQDQVAAAVIGGANLMGGVGTAFGAVVGAALIEVIRNSLILLGISTFWQGTFVGSFIVIAVLFDRLRSRHANE
jgi:D-glycero-alpha-D-manno-heptose-7-phosphate kinase